MRSNMHSLEKVQVKKDLKIQKDQLEEPARSPSASASKPTAKRHVEKEIAYYSKLPSCTKMANKNMSAVCSCLVVVS